MRNALSKKIVDIQPSGIRKFFDVVSEIPDAISLGVGEPDFDTPWNVREEGIYALEKGRTFYTSNAGLKELREEICNYVARKYNVEYNPMKETLVTVGGSEAIDIALRCMIDPGDEVIIPQPSYVSYLPCAVMADAVPVFVNLKEENEFKLTKEELLEHITDKTKVLIMPFPNNPTGALYPKEVLDQIVEVAREHQLIIFSDEIYDRLVMDGEEHISIASLAPDLFCVTFSGLSKSHMIAGYRIGWMILSGNKSIAKDYMEGLNMLSNMRLCSNVPAQSIVQTALGGHQSVNGYIVPGGRIYEQREYIYKALNDIPGISAVKPKAAFYIFPKIDTKKFNIYDDDKFALDLLREKKILIIHGAGFNWGEPDHFRVVYLPRIEVLKDAVDKMEDFLKTYKQR